MKAIKTKQPCVNPACGSSDAMTIYEDGHGYCFSCNKPFHNLMQKQSAGSITIPQKKSETFQKVNKIALEDIKEYPIRGFRERAIKAATCEAMGVRVSYSDDGSVESHYYPFSNDKEIIGYKERTLPKEFSFIGKSGGLFGRNCFSGGGKRLIITEGELDALSVAQASLDKYGKVYPVVSIQSSTILKGLIEHRDWIRSFNEVVLAFDADENGDKATSEAVKIIGPEKIKIAKFPNDCKDFSDVLVKHGSLVVNQSIWDAGRWQPKGIISKEDLWKALTEYNKAESLPYPECLTGLNSKLKGMRMGEIALFISGTGSGKSTLLREVMLEVLNKAPIDTRIGVISLEESPPETARKLSGMVINRNPAEEEIPLDDIKVGFDQVFGSDRVELLDHQGSIKDDSILDRLEYMCLVGCKYLFIDHITILVSEGADGLTGNEAIDKIMNDLLRLVKKHNVWIGLVSHLRKPPGGGKSFEEGKLPSIDDIRGSGSIKQISFDIIGFARNLITTDETERNTIKMVILKSRYTGLTGTVPGAFYDRVTGRLRGISEMPDDLFTAV